MSNSSITCLIKDDIKYVEDKHMTNILNEHFVTVMTKHTSNPPAFDYNVNHHMSDIRFSENDIANLLITIKPHKAIGPDSIHPSISTSRGDGTCQASTYCSNSPSQIQCYPLTGVTGLMLTFVHYTRRVLEVTSTIIDLSR